MTSKEKKEYYRLWYQNNKEKRKAYYKVYHQDWYRRNKTKILAKNREYYLSHYVKKIPPLYVRFWKRVDKQKENDCWEWKGLKYPSGYGRMGNVYAHRLSYTLNCGEIPKGLHVCHSCDNPSCVNPKHLWVGTVADNMRDRDKKGRDRFSKMKSI